MLRRPPRSTRTDTLFPYTTLFRSASETLASISTSGLRFPTYTSMHDGHCGVRLRPRKPTLRARSEEHTSELQSLMRISYAVFCLKKKTIQKTSILLTTLYTQIQ